MRRGIHNVRRIVVKVGTNLLSSADGIDRLRIDAIVEDIAALREKGVDLILVSSGAIGLGAKELKKKAPIKQVALRQACASIGQPILMSHYRDSFKKHDLICSQVLITRSELSDRKTFVNLRNSVDALFDLHVIPVFNENDAVSTAEIGSAFGDNDRMSALVASKIDADLLIILTDIDGLYDKKPTKGNKGQLLKEVETIDETIMSYAGTAGSSFATGGMKTKLLAAKIASTAGCATIIASGYEKDILQRLYSGEPLGTYIHAHKQLNQRSRWIVHSSAKGCIRIDEGAVKALRNHKSLLPSGVLGVEGVFHAGDVVMINDVAKAVPYYDSATISAVAGLQSKDITIEREKGKIDVLFRPEDIVFLDYEK
ncbi:MAG: glutamate 5-kinase [Sphaerochaetaceae bacterium]|jgi:glutamate 5-kinase